MTAFAAVMASTTLTGMTDSRVDDLPDVALLGMTTVIERDDVHAAIELTEATDSGLGGVSLSRGAWMHDLSDTC